MMAAAMSTLYSLTPVEVFTRLFSATVIGWRLAADAGLGGIFAIDPLWPGLLVSVVLLLALTAFGPRYVAKAAA